MLIRDGPSPLHDIRPTKDLLATVRGSEVLKWNFGNLLNFDGDLVNDRR